MPRSTLLTALALSLVACGDAKAPKPTHAKVDAKADTKADAKADAAKGDEEKSEEEKKAEAEKKGKERLEKLAKAVEKEQGRWTDEIKAAAKDLAGANHKDLNAALAKILAGPHRTPGNADRDKFRHPLETLQFFGIGPESTVLEVGPGAGWYTEILAPLLATRGRLVVTDYDESGGEFEYSTYNAKRMAAFLGRSEDMFGKVDRVVSTDSKDLQFGDPQSVDVALVFRGMHGWTNRGDLDGNLKKIHAVLKAGGTLGIVQHRTKAEGDPKELADKGYVHQEYLVKQVTAAGFELAEASEINANPKDMADHPEGVWNLPPTLTDEDKDREKYEAIGESDRMTLKFVKK